MNLKVSIFIPFYNEKKIIKNNVLSIYAHLKKMGMIFELFLVDDTSNDGSDKIASKIAKQYREIIHLRYKNGPSRRENLVHSFHYAKYDTIAFMDMDLATDLRHLKDLLYYINNGYDIATGSRHISGSKVYRSLDRHLISYLFKYAIKLYFGSKINDHECGFKAFKKSVILKLVNLLGYDYKRQRKMFWDTEMFLFAQKLGYRIKEVPIIWVEGKKSALRFRSEISMIKYIIKLRFSPRYLHVSSKIRKDLRNINWNDAN